MSSAFLKLALLVGIAAVVLGGVAFFLLAPDTLAKEIRDCNTAQPEMRFSCFRNALENHHGEGSIQEFLKELEDETYSFESKDNSYAIFGTNCHTFYHALGDLVATHTDGDLGKYLRSGPARCTSGYMMGFFKRTALEDEFDTGTLRELFRSCRPTEAKSCAHEIGHLLHDKYTVSILETLDGISRAEYGLEYPREYRYALFAQADLNAPFEECKTILPEDMQSYCYQGTGHNLFLYSEFDPEGYKTQFGQCSGVSDEANREECYSFLLYRIGINDGATKFLSYDFAGGNEVCEEAAGIIGREDLKKHCYLGIGGGMGLYLESEYPYDKITEDNLSQVKKRSLEVAGLCSKGEEDYKEKCLAGLLGTRFKDLYRALGLYNEEIEQLLPELDQGLEVIG